MSTTIDSLFAGSRGYFPGTLLLYDLETQKLYSIQTDQGDSEIVLVDGSNVYYRVNTALFRGKIGNRIIDDIREIAKDPVIGNVHWAFIPH